MLERDLAVGRGLVHADAERVRQRRVDLVPAEHPAEGVAADADEVLAGRLALVHRVERRDRGDLRLGDGEGVGAEGDAVGRHVALLGLHEVQHRQQRRPRLTIRVARDDRLRVGPDARTEHRRVPGTVELHQGRAKVLATGVTGLARLDLNRHRSHPPITGSIDATDAITSATRPPIDSAAVDCRLMKLGSRKCTRYGRVDRRSRRARRARRGATRSRCRPGRPALGIPRSPA